MAVIYPQRGESRSGIFSRIFRSRTLWVSLLALCVLAAAALGGRWAYGKWINRQSWKLAGLAQTQLRDGQVNEALMSLETALRLRPDNPSALRQLAQIHASLGQRQEALAAWQKLAAAKALTAADAEAYGLLAGVEGEWALANLIIDGFSAGNPGPEPDLLRANILAMRGDKAGAEESLRNAVTKDKTARSRAILARFLLTQRLNNSTAPEVLALHRDLITLPDDTGAQALADALQGKIVPARELPTWLEALRKHPRTTPELVLVADSAEATANPAAAPLIAAKVFARLEHSPIEDRQLGFLWLARHNQPERARRLVSREEALGNQELFTSWIETLAATGDLAQIPETLDLPANPLPAQRSELYRARTLKLLDRTEESAQAYQRALAASSGNTTETLRVLAFLHDAGEADLFESELQKILAQPDTARPALESLRPVVAKRRDIQAIRRFQALALAAPGVLNKTQIQNEIDYCDLILDRPVDTPPLAELSRRNPGNLRFRTTHALALFRDGENAKALSELVAESTQSDEPDLLARRSAIQALALTASADPVEATKTLAALDPSLLTLQEVALIRTTRASPEAITALVERTKGASSENRHLTAALLARQKDFAAALDLVPLDDAIAKPEIFLPWLDACSALGRWEETLAALARPDNPLPVHTTRFLTGLALKNLGKPSEALAAFESALAESGDDPAKFTATLAALFQARETELFEKNLAKIQGRPDLARAAFKALLPAIQAQRDTALTLRFYELTAVGLPDLFQLPATQNDLAYLHLILGRSTPLQPLIQRATADPGNLSLLATLALARLQSDDPAAALASFAEFRPDFDFQSLPPRIQAIYAATLAANGQKDSALRIAASIPAESLSSQEESFLRPRLE